MNTRNAAEVKNVNFEENPTTNFKIGLKLDKFSYMITMKLKHQIPSDFWEKCKISEIRVQKATCISHLTIIIYLFLVAYTSQILTKKLDKFDLLKDNFLPDCSRVVNTFAKICLSPYIYN